MKIKKYILSLLIGATALSFSACNDFLDRDPLGQFTEDDAPNALVGGKMYNVYYLMRGYDITAGIPAFMIHMVRSEDSEKGSDAGDGGEQAAMYDDFEYTASNGPLGAYWSQNYKIIYQCNEILDDIEKSANKDDTENIRTKGEALFFRAYCYFNLVRAFGEVPLIDFKINQSSDANIPKSSVSDIYALIDRDLTEAEKYLPRTWESKYIGRLTWGAARSLHAYSPMGKELDSLSDMVSFGVAPGMIVYWLLEQACMTAPVLGEAAGYVPYMALVIPVFSGLRLAKFNIDERQTTSFIGMPVPAHALFWASIGYAFHSAVPVDSIGFIAGTIVAAILFSSLLVSEVPMFSLKVKSLAWKGNELRYILVAGAVVFVTLFGVLGIAGTVILYITLSFFNKRR